MWQFPVAGARFSLPARHRIDTCPPMAQGTTGAQDRGIARTIGSRSNQILTTEEAHDSPIRHARRHRYCARDGRCKQCNRAA